MKKIVVVVVIAVMMALAIGTSATAQGLMKVTGTVTKIDTGAMSVTIQPQEGPAITIIMQDAEKLSKIKEGANTEVRYRVKDGKNAGIWLHNLDDGGCS